MVDASFVKVPRQRNTREENKHIKGTGTAPHEWKVKPHKLAQKDVDARWTKKNNKEKSRTRARVVRLGGWICRKQHERFIYTYYWNCKG